MSYLKYLFFILKEYFFFFKKKEKLIKNLLLASSPDCTDVGETGAGGIGTFSVFDTQSSGVLLYKGQGGGGGGTSTGQGCWHGWVGWAEQAQVERDGWGSRSWSATQKGPCPSPLTVAP